jgi:predicted ABC-type ATPase
VVALSFIGLVETVSFARIRGRVAKSVHVFEEDHIEHSSPRL